MGITLRALTATLAGAVGGGLFLVAASAAPAGASDQAGYSKREEASTELVTVDDDDDLRDPTATGNTNPTNPTATSTSPNTNPNTRSGINTANTNPNTNSGVDTATGQSNSAQDGTNSRVTAVSRDRDLSRRDLTKDWTRDGGDKTRDKSANHTNDNSRNDTRR